MAVPKRKTSPSARGMRRAHLRLKQRRVREDKTTGEIGRPHHISPDGYYNGRQVTKSKVNV